LMFPDSISLRRFLLSFSPTLFHGVANPFTGCG
jgi:hypothetical protein